MVFSLILVTILSQIKYRISCQERKNPLSPAYTYAGTGGKLHGFTPAVPPGLTYQTSSQRVLPYAGFGNGAPLRLPYSTAAGIKLHYISPQFPSCPFGSPSKAHSAKHSPPRSHQIRSSLTTPYLVSLSTCIAYLHFLKGL